MIFLRMLYRDITIILLSLGLFMFSNGSWSHAQSPQPVPGGTLIYAIPGTPDTLDPQATTGTLTFQYLKSVYDTLVEPDELGNFVPALAESWEFSQEDLTLTFHLRRGVQFHNGAPFTAADVKATFDRILAPASTSPHKSLFSSVQAITSIDDFTVQFQLTEIYAPLLATLGSGWSAILPKQAIDEGHDFSTHPIGTGPFQFKEWRRDEQIVYTKFADYWMPGKPYLDGITFKVVVEPTTQLLGLSVGEFDLIQVVEPHTIPKLNANPETKVFTHPTALALIIGMNHARPPFDNPLIRKAVCHAIDRRALLDVAYTGGDIIGAFLDSGNPYYVDYSGMYPYEPAKAKELLAEAGYPNGFESTIAVPQNYSQHVNAGNMVQNMLQQVGITAKIQLMDWGTWISQVYRGRDYAFTIIGHTGKLDPHERLDGFGIPEENYVNYQNPDVAQLIARAAVTTEHDQRAALYAKIQQLMAEDAMMVFIGTPLGLRGMRSTVHGFRMTYALDTPDFRETFKTE